MSDKSFSFVRPGDSSWPGEGEWDRLRQEVGGRLLKVESPFADLGAPEAADAFFAKLKNPYFIGDRAGLTQTLGWVGAWTSQPSAYAVAVAQTSDVVAAIKFARRHNIRVVIKGGAHSYKGTSNAAGSLLIWTRQMRGITLHDDFVATGCEALQAPAHAVTVEAGVLWGQAYDAVTTRAGRYVQGGGCLSVGVAGLVQAGGFGSLSKAFGLAAASLLEAEVVTADGEVRIANAATNPDLFWALKGGGGGTFGVVTRLTLATHRLPSHIGRAAATIEASSGEAYRRLAARFLGFYREALFNPHWGERAHFMPGRRIAFNMVFQGFDADRAEEIWRPFLDWVASQPDQFTMLSPFEFRAVAGHDFWNPRIHPASFIRDDQPEALETSVFWTGNQAEAGVVLHAYQSSWIPAALLADDRLDILVDALCAAASQWEVALHMNKGLAGASDAARETARQTAMNPAVLDAFALLISGAGGPSAYPGVAGHEPGEVAAAANLSAIERAMHEIRKAAPGAGCYSVESDYHEPNWQQSFWGGNYARLLAVKQAYDPGGFFRIHQGVGSERYGANAVSHEAASAAG